MDILDNRNDINNLANNIIIYGHRRKNNSMFGTLKNILTDDWRKTDNHIIKIANSSKRYLFQVFSVIIFKINLKKMIFRIFRYDYFS